MKMIKFLNLQMIPWCIHMMGNHLSCLQVQAEPSPATTTIKVIRSDGGMDVYERPVRVSEVMREHPKHLVCRSDSIYIGRKIPALSEEDHLQLGHNYFLLPIHMFQSALSFVTVASFATQSRNAFLNKAGVSCQPFHIEKSESGFLRIQVSDQFIWQLMQEATVNHQDHEITQLKASDVLCTTPQLRKDYMSLVRSQRWRPKLDTIREIVKQRRFATSLGLKTSKLHASNTPQSSYQQLHVITNVKAPNNSFIFSKSRL